MKWIHKEKDEIKLKKLKKIEGMPALLASVLSARDDADIDMIDSLINTPIETFMELYKQYSEDDNLQQAAEKIAEYTKKDNAEIWVFADFDVDGITSGYTMTHCLRMVTNNKVYVYFPEKTDGYGLSHDFCDSLIEYKKENEKEDYSILVVTVDNGIACLSQVDKLLKNKIDVVVTDHHQPKEKLPKCIVYNPQTRSDNNGKEMAGCGVAFMVANEMSKKLGYDDFFVTSHYLPYVAIGTIADVMPMKGINPFIIKLGFNAIAMDENNEFLSLKTWKDKIGIKTSTFMIRDIGWNVGPRLNACARLGQTTLAAEIIFSDDEDSVIEAARAIEKVYKDRKTISDKIVDIAMEQREEFEKQSICTFDCSEFPIGMAGLMANKLIDIFNKPVALVYGKTKQGIYVGSARSTGGFPIKEFIDKEEQAGNMVFCGGHEQACGFGIKEENLEDFLNNINEAVSKSEWLLDISQKEDTINIDGEITLRDLTVDNYEAVNGFPIGEEATFIIKNCLVEEVIESKNNPSNIKLCLRKDNYHKKIWAWGANEKWNEIGCPSYIDIVGNLSMFGGEYTLSIADFKESEK